ncbi:hypothetical protein [Sphingomonas sp. LHG3406-1]|uniref:hypothetical protein n=1 Tax=Sphingomonas sp. LHG3406-1 TaxID=2804617 RepID=UPI002611880E|nr:hypothetical protein [Sphingomonas sp. LHG3406-1]
MNSFTSRLSAIAGAATMMVSAPAAAAVQARTAAYSPWAALSAFASPASSQALCGAAAATAAGTAATQSASGCVLPATDAAPAAAPESAAPAVVGTAGANSFSILPLLFGLAVLGGAAALAFGSDEDGGDVIAISPA